MRRHRARTRFDVRRARVARMLVKLKIRSEDGSGAPPEPLGASCDVGHLFENGVAAAGIFFRRNDTVAARRIGVYREFVAAIGTRTAARFVFIRLDLGM